MYKPRIITSVVAVVIVATVLAVSGCGDTEHKVKLLAATNDDGPPTGKTKTVSENEKPSRKQPVSGYRGAGVGFSRPVDPRRTVRNEQEPRSTTLRRQTGRLHKHFNELTDALIKRNGPSGMKILFVGYRVNMYSATEAKWSCLVDVHHSDCRIGAYKSRTGRHAEKRPMP